LPFQPHCKTLQKAGGCSAFFKGVVHFQIHVGPNPNLKDTAVLQDKRSELEAEKRKKLLTRLLDDLSKENPDLYYQPTSAVAVQIMEHIANAHDLHVEEKALLTPLSQHDIEVLLSMH